MEAVMWHKSVAIVATASALLFAGAMIESLQARHGGRGSYGGGARVFSGGSSFAGRSSFSAPSRFVAAPRVFRSPGFVSPSRIAVAPRFHHRRIAPYFYGAYAGYGAYGYGAYGYDYYGGGCSALERRAVLTNDPYWWERYEYCLSSYDYGY